MGKDVRLANIYIKIHNKYALTLEDLKYLAKVDPECFEKACKNIVYRMPETKKIMQPKLGGNGQPESGKPLPSKTGKAIPAKTGKSSPSRGKKAASAKTGKEKKLMFENPPADRERIEAVLSNLKQMERKDLPVGEIRVDQVKELLGNLYMELLFPHNDRDTYFNLEDFEELSVFNKKA